MDDRYGMIAARRRFYTRFGDRAKLRRMPSVMKNGSEHRYIACAGRMGFHAYGIHGSMLQSEMGGMIRGMLHHLLTADGATD